MSRTRTLVLILFTIAIYAVVTSPLLSAVAVTSMAGSQPARFASQWPQTDFSRASIDLAEVTSGGPPKDGIPAIDQPHFISIKQAALWLHQDEPVIVVDVNGKARAYPLQILIYHEIVNDRFQGVPLAITFCPLCNASIVFDRRLDGRELDFGTTGNLRKSDLVMYDRQTHSWWQQFTGEAIVGELTGKTLVAFASRIVSFSTFAADYPDAEVLSRRTGYSRPYGSNPYRGYDRVGDIPFLFTDPLDDRLPAMERVIGVEVDPTENRPVLRLYPFSVLQQQALLHDSPGGMPIVIFMREGLLSVLDQALIADSRKTLAAVAFDRRVDGRELTFHLNGNLIQDEQTGSSWSLLGRAVRGPLTGKQLRVVDKGVHFAFAWLAFHPHAEIYSAARQ